jgi:hypothetical protein
MSKMSAIDIALDAPEVHRMMRKRYKRGNLQKGVSYIKVNKTERTKVGKFVQSGYQGSGDGMELVLVFELNGKNHVVYDEMWGTMDGSELSYFEKDE